MLIGVMACAELYIHIKDKAWKDLGISLSVLALSLLLVVGTKASWLEMNQSYLKETMRGGHSELTSNSDSGPTSIRDFIVYDYFHRVIMLLLVSLSINMLSGPMLNNRSAMLKLGMNPCFSLNTW